MTPAALMATGLVRVEPGGSNIANLCGSEGLREKPDDAHSVNGRRLCTACPRDIEQGDGARSAPEVTAIEGDE